MKIKTYTYKACPDALVDFYHDVYQDKNNKLAKNYHPDDIFNECALCYSISVTGDGNPVAGSVAWARLFYNGAVRVGTRYAIHPVVRRQGGLSPKSDYYKSGIRTYAVEQLDQQIAFVENLGYYNQFISREDRKGWSTKRVFNGIKTFSKYEWNFSDDTWLVCPNEQKISCWQRIGYRGKLCLTKKL